MDFLLFLCYHKREFCGEKFKSQIQTYIKIWIREEYTYVSYRF